MSEESLLGGMRNLWKCSSAARACSSVRVVAQGLKRGEEVGAKA